MTRIISGMIGSLRLRGPAKSTRPTADRIKESIFSTLDSMGVIEGSEVLDLYAGTGALGLEAASRGAASVTLVESNAQAALVCRENIALASAGLEKQGFNPRILLYTEPVKKFLQRGAGASLVFLDPPYELSDEELESNLKVLAGTGALLVIERSSKSPIPGLPTGYQYSSERSFGDTKVYFATEYSGQ